MREFMKWSSLLYLHLSSCLDMRLARFGLNRSHHFYVLRVCENPGISRDTLVHTVYRDQSNVTRALSHLESLGYLRRETNAQDRRACYYYPTEKALAEYEEIAKVVSDLINEILEPFSEEERRLFPALLEKAGLTAYEIHQRDLKNERLEELT